MVRLRDLILTMAAMSLAMAGQASPAAVRSPSATVDAGSQRSTMAFLAALQQQIGGLRSAVGALNPDGWRTTADERASLVQAQASLKRNLDEAVPSLLTAYRAAPQNYGAAFRLYRDLDSISQVCLSATDAASRYAPTGEAQPLEDAAAAFNQALEQLGDIIEKGAAAQYANSLKSEPAPKPHSNPPAPPRNLVIQNANGKSGGGGE